jgi:hypothetical protein
MHFLEEDAPATLVVDYAPLIRNLCMLCLSWNEVFFFFGINSMTAPKIPSGALSYGETNLQVTGLSIDAYLL